ncbi:hypothetical protein EZV62_017948 [Acer yangbiense]|uniref:NTF2 domain-containing protein n=1 Tax=Acer yangbiense TaxID=1000413 RepID=A0A5C7HIQ6_9ROSI|nr:hypothetical protein EZV62_017948 [Acer yangbiense]
MASQADSSAVSPQLVGNAFVEQYYRILHQSPDMVHKFYNESSMLSRPDSSGTMTSVKTMEGINDQILSMDYQNFKVQIFHADAQVSCNGGVIVLVTGCLIGKENLRRKFTQSFFLAPQEIGYFVLNDVFRYVDEKEESVVAADENINGSVPTALLTPDSVPTQVADHHVSNHESTLEEDTNSCKETSHLLDNGKIAISEKRVDTDSSVKSIQNDALPVKQTAASKTQEEAPKKSYASVVHDLNKSKSPFNSITRSPPAKPVQQLRTTAAAAPEASAPSGNRTVERNNDRAVKGHSIFIGNLPESATVLQLKEIFEQFGPIKPDGIQVRSQKQRGNCFGFVEFESASAVQSVFQAAPIMIGDRRASIEEKRGNSGGGRFPQNQGGYRDNNFRGPRNFNGGGGRGGFIEGRGNFIGGRGYRRNDYEKRGNFSGRDRSGSERNGEASQMVHVGHQSGGGGGAPRQGDMKE